MFWGSRRERIIEIMNRGQEEPAVPQESGQKLSAEGELLNGQEFGTRSPSDRQQTAQESDPETLSENQEEERELIGYQKGDFIPMMAASFAAWLLAILGILLVLAIVFFLFRAIVS
ncbi:MAG TPA: hypothetical protein VFF56_02155 [Bacillota bacterium]|nr:hypothetical protein [Bacillota bacterium]